METSSKSIQDYFAEIDRQITTEYAIVEKARKKKFDPEENVEIPIAKNMAERVVGLISVVAPQIIGKGIDKRILELEQEFGALDWRVGFKIAEEVAKEKFCSFKDKQEAIETGIRVGFAYLTLGIVSAPLEGFIGLKIKKRKDGKEYLALQYAGPIRAAGGTAASTSVILSDYVRVKMGFAPYDPDEKEISRYTSEVHDYHERITNLQYHPSDEELKFMVSHLPVEVDGDPTEKIEVSNYKDLPRIETNLIRGGVALVLAEGLCQKTPKLWKRLAKWGKEFELEWEWLQDFLKLKEQIHASHSVSEKEKTETEKKIKPNNTFIMDLVAGRPILTHPLAEGGFRLRYGRTRVSGFSSCGVHPATLIALNKFIAIGTQLKVERPGKGATVTICDSIDGPIVRLKNGSISYLQTERQAKEFFSEIEEIIFLGDILFNYGDFSENGHSLVPVGYCPEWWALEVENVLSTWFKEDFLSKGAAMLHIDERRIKEFLQNPFFSEPSLEEALSISISLHLPLHPSYTFYWKLISGKEVSSLKEWFCQGKIKLDEKGIKKIILPLENENHSRTKKILERLGVPHEVINNEHVVLSRKEATIFAFCFDFKDQKSLESIFLDEGNISHKNGLEAINSLTTVLIRDKAGTFIGARMGRPEKAKMRQMTGSPQVMFPVGDEGDRLRSFQAALSAGKVRSTFPFYYCLKCQRETIYRKCEICDLVCEKRYSCRFCGDLKSETCRHGKGVPYKVKDLDIGHYFSHALSLLKEPIHADLIKGIRGTSNKEHVVEHLAKGILRAKHNIYVNKDGTTRYDCTELPLTHFKPKEIKTTISKLKKLGYEKDIYGKELIDENQLLELKPQDVILPGFDSLEESAPTVLCNVAKFVDELLVKLYGLEPFYNIAKAEDLVGHLVIGLAPHISAGLVGRIIGFSETQGLITHPMYHAGMRRDCFHYDSFLPIYNGQYWEITKIGQLVEKLNPKDVIDDFGTKEIKISNYKTLGGLNNTVPIRCFTKHTPQPMIKITTKLGRVLTVTYNHKQLIFAPDKKTIPAHQLKIGDQIAAPYVLRIPQKDITELDLIDLLAGEEWAMVRNVNSSIKEIKKHAKLYFNKKEYDNYTRRDSYPITFIYHLKEKGIIKDTKEFSVAAKRDSVNIPAKIPVDKELLQIIGLYIAEGYSRKIKGSLYQIYIAASDHEVRRHIQKSMHSLFGIYTSENKHDRVTYSSRVLYHLFTSILQCGSSAYEKRIPSLFLNLPKEKSGYLLSGYLEGDGSVSISDLRVVFDTVSEGLLQDIHFVLGQMGIFVKTFSYTRQPGKKVKDFYVKNNKEIPFFTITRGIIQSIFVKRLSSYVGFISSRKKKIFRLLLWTKKARGVDQRYDNHYVYDTITTLELLPEEESYCLTVPQHEIVVNSILTGQCDGDEASVMLLMDALLNFSRHYLPEKRGAKTMDSCLVLTTTLIPSEIDDQVHGVDVVWRYPLELYIAAGQMKNPWDVRYDPEKKKIEQLSDRLGTPLQYEQFGFTHPVDNFNKGIQCSAYKILPSMEEKLFGQMEIARKVRAVDMDDVAKLVIQKHFLRDIKGNLRKFSMQQFRCVKCNEKYRRPPLVSKCTACGGKLTFTISEGSVIKYLIPSLKLAEKYDFSPYLKQTLNILKTDVDALFGKEKEKQVGLGEFIS